MTKRRLALLVAAACTLLVVLVVSVPRSRRTAEPPLPPAGRVDDPEVNAAIENAAAAVRKSPDDADAWAALAMTYDANEIPSLAATCYREAVDRRPNEPTWWYGLAFVLEREDDFDAAAVALHHAAAIDPTYPPLHYSATLWALARGRLDDAEVAAQRTLETSRGAAGGYIAMGRVQLERGRDEEAAKTLARAVETWPPAWGDPAYVRFLLGTALARLGRTAEAEPLLANGVVETIPLPDPWRDAVEMRREGLKSRLRRARFLAESNRLNEAIAIFESLQRRYPDNIPVATDLGSTYMLASRAEEAVALLKKTVAAHPEAAPPAAQLVKVLWEAGRREESLRAADAAVTAHPQAVETLTARGAVLLRADRAEAALADFEAVARLAPRSAPARASAGEAQLRLRRLDRARAAFEDALRCDGNYPAAIAGMALVAMENGDTAAADEWLRKIADVPPQAADLVAEARQARAKAK